MKRACSSLDDPKVERSIPFTEDSVPWGRDGVAWLLGVSLSAVVSFALLLVPG